MNLTLEQTNVLNEMLYGKNNLVINGKAGTGKSTIIQAFQRQYPYEMACLASTGIAAQMISGATIHSFFKFPPCTLTPQDIDLQDQRQVDMLRTVHTILFDEAYMIRSDVFSAIDNILRQANASNQPFGGKRIILVGDMFQLPPVVADLDSRIYLEHNHDSEYFFSTQSYRAGRFKHMILDQSMRQNDPGFVEFLDAVRTCSHQLGGLLACYNPILQRPWTADERPVHLCCTRHTADTINQEAMFHLEDPGIIATGDIEGEFPENELPTSMELPLKRGARVMVLVNRSNPSQGGYDFVNGQPGTVIAYDPVQPSVTLQLDNGQQVALSRNCWTRYAYDIEYGDRGSLNLVRREVGSFWQLPILPAYAITIHKSQGQTLDRVHINLEGGCFVSGQAYTALSRVRSLNNVTIAQPIHISDAFVDPMLQEHYEAITAPEPDWSIFDYA